MLATSSPDGYMVIIMLYSILTLLLNELNCIRQQTLRNPETTQLDDTANAQRLID